MYAGKSLVSVCYIPAMAKRTIPPQVGKTYGRLTVVEEVRIPSRALELVVVCVCSPSKRMQKRYSDLKNGVVRSCGCLRQTSTSDSQPDSAYHGRYSVWRRMRPQKFPDDHEWRTYVGFATSPTGSSWSPTWGAEVTLTRLVDTMPWGSSNVKWTDSPIVLAAKRRERAVAEEVASTAFATPAIGEALAEAWYWSLDRVDKTGLFHAAPDAPGMVNLRKLMSDCPQARWSEYIEAYLIEDYETMELLDVIQGQHLVTLYRWTLHLGDNGEWTRVESIPGSGMTYTLRSFVPPAPRTDTVFLSVSLDGDDFR